MSIWETDGGLYLGYDTDKLEGPPIVGEKLRYKGDRSVVIFGPNGSGKSMRWILRNASTMLPGWSKVIIDPKGDLAGKTINYCKAHGAKTHLFHPFGAQSDGYNALSSLDPKSDDFIDDAMGHAEALIDVSRSKDPHWGESYQDIIAATAMYVRLVMPEEGTYGTVRELLLQRDEALREMITGETFVYKGKQYPGMMCAGVDHDWPEIGHKMAPFASISPENRELHSILNTGRTQTRFLDSRRIKKEMKGPAFDFRALKHEPHTVYLVLPPRRLVTHAKWLRLMLTCIVQDLLNDTREAKVPVVIICDEAAALGHLAIFEELVALIRGYGIKLVTIWQGIEQLRSIYKDRWETFIGNAGVLQNFSTQDLATSEFISARTGQTSRQSVSYTVGQGIQAGAPPSLSSSASSGSIPVPLMLPQEIRNMDDGYSLIFSHHAKGAVRSYLPFPTEMADTKPLYALDPLP